MPTPNPRVLAIALLVPAAVLAQAQTWGQTSTYVSVGTSHWKYGDLVERDGNGLQSWIPGQSQGASASTASGRSEGSASATDGTLHAFAKTSLSSDSADGQEVFATTNVGFRQMVTLTNPFDFERDVPMALSIDGDWSDLGHGVAYVQVMTGPNQLAFNLLASLGKDLTQPWDTNWLTLPAHSSMTIAIDGTLDAYAYSNPDHLDSLADYSHTAHFLWDLPQGVTATGIGGAFNPGSIPKAVPEPASLAVLGFGALGLLRRRAGRKGA